MEDKLGRPVTIKSIFNLYTEVWAASIREIMLSRTNAV